MVLLLLRRKFLSAKNRILAWSVWEWARNTAFLLVGLWMLVGIYYGFWRLLSYLNGVQLIGPLLIWKLTAMAMLTTFSMVIVSSLIISLTTLFYASDLRFLMRSPLPLRAVFLDKSIEAVFFSSWMIALVLFPYVSALCEVQGYGLDFHLVFTALLIPFLILASVLGMAFTLLLMYFFPSSRTRDVVWILSSISVALLYVLLRLSEPERLVRPDMLSRLVEYLHYLQTPTAPYAPSWWLTQALRSYAQGEWGATWFYGLALVTGAVAAYGILFLSAGYLYASGYSGAQEGRSALRPVDIPPSLEARLASLLKGRISPVAVFFWKERKIFFRDVSHWSQIVLIAALACVYLFSIYNLPLDSPDLKSLVCFLNIGLAGFVLASLCLRFTFPSVSLEGSSFWVAQSAPVGMESLMQGKFLFSLLPMTFLATLLVAVSNHLLKTDFFIYILSLATIWVMTWTLCGMGIGLGAVFPRFRVENIHQVESSAGGFLYMACALAYVGVILAIEAVPAQMYFQQRLGRADSWNWRLVSLSALGLVLLNAAAFLFCWISGRMCLESYEGE